MEQSARFGIVVLTGSCCLAKWWEQTARFFRVIHSACMLDAADSPITLVSTIPDDCHISEHNILQRIDYIIYILS